MTKNSREQGSSALALMIGVLSAGMTFVYIQNKNVDFKQAVNAARQVNNLSSKEIADLSSLARFRSLIESKKLDDGSYQPAIFPENYFEAAWQLNPNANIQKDIKGEKEDFSITGNSVRITQTAEPTFDEIQKSFQEGKVKQGPSEEKTIQFLKANFEGAALVKSVDVSISTANFASIQARIPIGAPVAFNPVLELRKVGDSDWIRNFSGLPAGNYEGRVLGSGVVYEAQITINGHTLPTMGGFGPDGKIRHEAVNALARDKEIGRFTYNFDSSLETLGFDSKICQPTTVDGTFNYQIALINADQKIESIGIKNETFSISQANLAHELGLEEFKTACAAECPWFDAYDFDIRAPQIRAGSYSDYSFSIAWDFTRNRVHSRSYKICESIAKTGVASKIELVPGYLDLGNQELNDLTMVRGSIDGHSGSSVEMLAFKPPACKRQFLYARETCGCFADKTRIRMEDGSEKLISELKASDRVWNPVLKKGQSIRRMTKGPEELPLFRIISGGNEVLVTGTHPFATKEGLVSAFELHEGQEISSQDGAWKKIERIEIKAPGAERPIVWNLELEGPDTQAEAHFVEANGIVTGDLFLQSELQIKGKSALSLLQKGL